MASRKRLNEKRLFIPRRVHALLQRLDTEQNELFSKVFWDEAGQEIGWAKQMITTLMATILWRIDILDGTRATNNNILIMSIRVLNAIHDELSEAYTIYNKAKNRTTTTTQDMVQARNECLEMLNLALLGLKAWEKNWLPLVLDRINHNLSQLE